MEGTVRKRKYAAAILILSIVISIMMAGSTVNANAAFLKKGEHMLVRWNTVE
jgi:hypothetical protein